MYRMPPSSNESHMDSHFNESFDVSKSLDGSVRISEQENPALEPKKQKDFDNWKNVDKEAKDKKKQRDAGIEGDRPEKGITMCGKESDDGCADGEIAIERERGVFNFGVQQRKRMLRPRDSPQVANCEPRFMSHAQDSEGCQGKRWTIMGDIYTNDSDLVAVLMHTAYFRPTASPPPAIQELCATIRVLPSRDSYISMLRNNVRSHAWGAGIGCSYHVERWCIVKKGGGTIDLEPCFPHTSAVEPTLAPVAVNRTMTTRALASV